jgi:hypothetical protein
MHSEKYKKIILYENEVTSFSLFGWKFRNLCVFGWGWGCLRPFIAKEIFSRQNFTFQNTKEKFGGKKLLCNKRVPFWINPDISMINASPWDRINHLQHPLRNNESTRKIPIAF